MSNVIIPAEHASVPKRTEHDRQIELAQNEIAEGRWTAPDKDTNIFGQVDDFCDVGTNDLAQHPRVQEVIEKLQKQVTDKTNPEYLEKAEELYEVNAQRRKKFQWNGQERWQGAEAEKSRLINWHTPFWFIEQLQHAGIKADHSPGEYMERVANPRWRPGNLEPVTVDMPVVKSNALVYLGKRVIDGTVGIFAKVQDKQTGTVIDKRVNHYQYPTAPEWSLMQFDHYNLPKRELYHGWRTVVLALILNRVITEEQAIEAFGEATGPACDFYKQQLFEFRNEAVKH